MEDFRVVWVEKLVGEEQTPQDPRNGPVFALNHVYFNLHHVPDKETKEKIRITSEMMGIGFKALLKRKPGVLSEGEPAALAQWTGV